MTKTIMIIATVLCCQFAFTHAIAAPTQDIQSNWQMLQPMHGLDRAMRFPTNGHPARLVFHVNKYISGDEIILSNEVYLVCYGHGYHIPPGQTATCDIDANGFMLAYVEGFTHGSEGTYRLTIN